LGSLESPRFIESQHLLKPPSRPQGSARSAIIFLALAAFASQAMVRVTDTLLPQIAADFQVSVGAASIVVTIYLLAHGSVQLIIGPIGDRFGKYWCVALATTASAIMVALCGLASSLPMLVVARLGSGLATGWIIPFALAFVGDVIPYQRRQQVLGRFLSGQILGQMSGQAASGVLGDLFGWRNVFFLLASLLAMAACGLYFELWRNPLTRSKHKTDQQVIGFVAGYATVLRSRWARTIILAVLIESAFMFGAFTYVGADLHLRFGLDYKLIGLFVGAFAIGGLIYSLSVPLLVRRLGQNGLAAGGGMVLGVAYLTLAVELNVTIAPVAIMAIGFGFYMLHNTLQTNATQMTPEARGTAVAIYSSALYLGQTVGVAAGGFLFDRFTAVPVFVMSAAALFALGLWLAPKLKEWSRRSVEVNVRGHQAIAEID
jgi:MFS transporter, YNFM family, putative membrane transport protein